MITGKKRSEREYRKLDMLSSSDIRMFASDRKKFYNKVVLKDFQEEESSRAILIGNLCHCLLLEPEEFDNKFFMSICSNPPTEKMLDFVNALFKHTVINSDESGNVTCDFEYIAKEAYAEAGFKWKFETVMEKFIGSEAENYYKELRESKTKGLQVVCVEDLDIATKIVQRIKEDEFVGEIFNQENTDNILVFNELQAEGFDVLGLEMKGMLDKIIVNHNSKTIQIYDLKVVWDNQNFVREYYLKKMAYIQAYVYHRALLSGVIDLGFDYENYEILPPIFVVVDSSNFYSPLMYKLSVEDLEMAYKGFTYNGREYKGVFEIINELKFAMETGRFNISKEAWQSGGVVCLNIG